MAVNLDIQSKAEVLLEALPYIQQFKGSIFVVKFGGSFMDTDHARIGVATDVAFLAAVGIHVVVVHGGGPAISKAMEKAEIEPVFRGGLRVTDEKTIEIVENTLNSVTNLNICQNLKAQGGKPQGIRGQDIFHCRKLIKDSAGEAIDLGYVGEIVGVDTTKLREVFDAGHTPIISPLAGDSNGQVYNVNADVAASALASEIGARRLVYLCDVPGLLRDASDPETLISTLPVSEVDNLKSSGVISSGMLPKVESAVQAINAGVHRVHFINGRKAHSILLEIFTDRGIGTEIVQ